LWREAKLTWKWETSTFRLKVSNTRNDAEDVTVEASITVLERFQLLSTDPEAMVLPDYSSMGNASLK
jgi:hypothetical protein